MKSKLSSLLIAAALAMSAATFMSNAVAAEDVKMLGPVTKIKLAADGKSATAVLKDSKSGESVTITVTDDLTLDKFKDKRIVEGDEIRARFEKDGVHKSLSFKKAAGC